VIRLIPDVETNYNVVQNERAPGFSVNFVVQQRLEITKIMSQNNVTNDKDNLSQAMLQLTTFNHGMK